MPPPDDATPVAPVPDESEDDEQEIELDPDVFNNFYVNLVRLKGRGWDPCCGSLMDVLRGLWVLFVHGVVFLLTIYLMTNVDSKGMLGMRQANPEDFVSFDVYLSADTHSVFERMAGHYCAPPSLERVEAWVNEGKSVDKEQCGRYDKWVTVAVAPGQTAVQRDPTDSDWVPGFGNQQSEWEVGYAQSRAECVRLKRENCPNARSISMPSTGSGSCWCQDDWGDDACSYDSFFCGSNKWCNITVNGVLYGDAPDFEDGAGGGSGRCQICNCAAFQVCNGDCWSCADLGFTDEAGPICCEVCNQEQGWEYLDFKDLPEVALNSAVDTCEGKFFNQQQCGAINCCTFDISTGQCLAKPEAVCDPGVLKPTGCGGKRADVCASSYPSSVEALGEMKTGDGMTFASMLSQSATQYGQTQTAYDWLRSMCFGKTSSCKAECDADPRNDCSREVRNANECECGLAFIDDVCQPVFERLGLGSDDTAQTVKSLSPGIDLKNHLKFWTAADRLWLYQEHHNAVPKKPADTARQRCEGKNYDMAACLTLDNCEWGTKDNVAQCMAPEDSKEEPSLPYWNLGRRYALESQLFESPFLYSVVRAEQKMQESSEQDGIKEMQMKLAQIGLWQNDDSLKSTAPFPFGMNIALDIFLRHNINAKPKERVLPIKWHWSSVGDGFGPSALIAVNGENDPDTMKKKIFDFFDSNCPTFKNQNPVTRLPKWNEMSESEQDAYLTLHRSAIKCSSPDCDRMKGYLDDGNMQQFVRYFNNGIIYGIFEEVRVKCIWQDLTLATKSPDFDFNLSQCQAVADPVSRIFWKNLNSEQQALAKELGYTDILWDKANARNEPITDKLRLTFQNYLTPNSGFLFTQVAAAVIVVVVVFFEVRHVIKTLMLAWMMDASILHIVIVGVLAVACYICVPVIVLQASMLVIFESGTELDVMKDALALLFMLEINNFLELTTTADSSRFQITVKKWQAVALERSQGHFKVVASVSVIVFALISGLLVSIDLQWAASAGLLHPSVLFNPMQKHPAAIGMCFALAFYFLVCVFIGWFTSTWSCKQCAFEKKPLPLTSLELVALQPPPVHVAPAPIRHDWEREWVGSARPKGHVLAHEFVTIPSTMEHHISSAPPMVTNTIQGPQLARDQQRMYLR